MGSKKLTPEERAAREARRAARSDRQVQRKVNEIASRVRHQLDLLGVDPNDIVKLDAEGFVAKRTHVTGTPENWPTINPVTPPDDNEDHDDSTATAD